MRRRTVERLIAVNRAFYSSRAAEFDASRRSPWPGWKRLLDHLDRDRRLSILDVGCGNGRFGRFARQALANQFDYCGMDSSRALLEAARTQGDPGWRWLETDLVLSEFPSQIESEGFDLVVCFGVMHHVPGETTRRWLAERMAARVGTGGLLAVSFWQFADDERFRRRVVPWGDLDSESEGGLEELDLERDDYLLRWGAESDDALAKRYCHHCNPKEIERLTAGLGLEHVESFSSDGQSGDLNRYVVLARR